MRTIKTVSTRDIYSKVKESIGKETAIEVDFSNSSGGSISNLPVKTDAYNTWLVEQQEKNLFIGKNYISRSTDDEIESEKVGEELVSEDTNINTDINIGENTNETGLTNDKSDDFINFSLIENNIKLLSDKSDDEIKSILTKQIEEHHKSIGKKDYKFNLPENIDDLIMENKLLLLTTIK